MTALLFAVERGYTQMVQLLINSGASITIQTKFGETAMQIALGNNYLDIHGILVEAAIALPPALPGIATPSASASDATP